MVNIGDKAAANKQANGEYLITEIGGSPNIGDKVFMHKMPNGEYLTNGISTVNVGDIAMAKQLKGLDKHYYCVENGGDDTCLRGISPTLAIDHNCGNLFSINGGWSFLFKLEKPISITEQVYMYITTWDRRPVTGQGEGPIIDPAGNPIPGLPQSSDFQNWYPFGRLRFGFSFDGFPQGCPEKSWVGLDGLPMSLGGQSFYQLIELGDLSLNYEQNTYMQPLSSLYVWNSPHIQHVLEWDPVAGAWVPLDIPGGWNSPYITDIWIHVRNTSSFAWCASGETKVSKLRICHQEHPELEDKRGFGVESSNEDWVNCMKDYPKTHPELSDTEIMNYCNQYV